MDIRTPGFTRFSRFGDNLGRLHCIAANHSEGLDGTDTLELTCTEDLDKNDYIVWRDRRGIWHEHIVDTHTRTHDDTGAPMTVATCINSIAETWDDYVVDKRPNGGVYSALSSILETTRWAAGPCTQEGITSHTFYHISAREALQELLETWGGELETVITCDGDRVTAREVRIRSVRGNQNSAKRFTWSKDLVTIAREVASDNPKSRIYAYGKGEETDSGGYGRRIGIESVNGGKAYVEDAEATKLWGHPMGDGTIAPACGIYVNETCDDPATLLAEAKKALEAAKVPTITYVADVLDLVSFGRDWEDVALGDLVTIVDKGFSDSGIRLRGRVSKLERDLFTYDTTVTFGNLVDAIATPWQSLQSKVSSLSSRASNWDLAGTASPEWLETLIQELNAAYNQAGTYHYSSFEQGEIWSNVPLDENGRATRSGGWAMNINGLGFRLASSLKADGSWNWRAFGNGNGFTADEITAGIIKGGSSFWNLGTGALTLTGGTIKSSVIEGSTLKITTTSGATLLIDAASSTIDIKSGSNHIQMTAFRILVENTSTGQKYTLDPYGITIDSGTAKMFDWTTPGKLVLGTDAGILPNSNSCIALYKTSGSNMTFDGCAIFAKGGFLNNFKFVWSATGTSYVEIQTLYGSYGLTAWSSDRHDKEQIADSETNATDILRRIRHRAFKYRDVTDLEGNIHRGKGVECGYIAQEMAEIDPSFAFMVGTRDEGGRMQIAEGAIIPILSKALQEMDERITALEREVSELRGAK